MPRKIILDVELIYLHMNKIQTSGLKSAIVKWCVSMLEKVITNYRWGF